MKLNKIYVHHKIECDPRCWSQVADQIQQIKSSQTTESEPTLYGIWRSQIGLPRDTITVISTWPNADTAKSESTHIHNQLELVQRSSATIMVPTLRPKTTKPPVIQGNYAFRSFETPKENFEEFLKLSEDAWPSFENSYDSQVIGLWRLADNQNKNILTLLLTRRPDLSMWERSKIPRTPEEIITRQKLSRRYDLCEKTVVYTSTLLTALETKDNVRWS